MTSNLAVAQAALLVAPERAAQRWVVGGMVFLGAFLAFSMEPIVGRLVTPFFGGAVHVWTVSLMIFQVLLLAGYLYAHLVAPRVGAWHLLVLLLPLLQWPLAVRAELAPEAPVTALVGTLLAQVSLLFIVLSTSAVVAQSWWYGASSGAPRAEPFFLYGISNLGAMLALFVYPFVVEPLCGVTVQRWAWSFGYLCYAGVTVGAWWLLRPRGASMRRAKDTVANPAASTVLRWLALSAAPSALLLAVTNVIAMEVGSFPMVWVFPLALYLGSFIVAFGARPGGVLRRIEFWVFEFALLALLAQYFVARGIWVLPLILIPFYALCLIANTRLYGLRPHPCRLTDFYLAIAVGGWIGGLLVSLAAPVLFSGLQEYPITVLAALVASWQGGQMAWWKTTSCLKGGGRLGLLMVGGTVLGLAVWGNTGVYSQRNFYGVAKVVDHVQRDGTPPYRMLVHGATLHGVQFLNPERRGEALGYYYTGGALAQAVAQRSRMAPVAMVGLGAGGALSWFEAGEAVHVFEIDPDMEHLARNWFSYLSDSAAQVSVQVGDARLNLAAEALQRKQAYGAIFIDAFSGDGVPTHLLTREALDIYLSRLAEDGLLVFHVSNRFYDLRPVLKAAARARGLSAVVSARKASSSHGRLRIDPWVVVLARRPERLAPLLAEDGWTGVGPEDGLPLLQVWTDDYINILAPLLVHWGL